MYLVSILKGDDMGGLPTSFGAFLYVTLFP